MNPHRILTVLLAGLCLCSASRASTTSAAEHPAAAPQGKVAQPDAINLATAPEASPDAVARSLLVLAKRMTERRDNDAAETAYIEVLNSPTSPDITAEALIGYAEFLRANGKDTRAAAIYEKFLSSFPGSQQANSVLIALGRTKEARKALDAAPEHPDAPDTGQAPLLYRAKLAHLQSLLLTQEGEAAKAVHASDEALVLLESKTQRPETGILYSLPYLRLLAARAEALEADGRQAEAAAFWKKAATYGTECLKLAPEHARLQRATEKAEQNAARLRAVGGARQ